MSLITLPPKKLLAEKLTTFCRHYNIKHPLKLSTEQFDILHEFISFLEEERAKENS